ncbi:MAG TPA: trypsin-like peptidase domain-containing protein, partial [Saprospiraceae bacterium]|nr:trypsin-like peptidase domain-containing protein [Saprospiraceae bacterium]
MSQNHKTLLYTLVFNLFVIGGGFLYFYHYYILPIKIQAERSIHPTLASNMDFQLSSKIGALLKGVSVDNNFVEVAQLSVNGVVSIKSVAKKNLDTNKEVFEQNSGSGVIISSDGYIVTNNHVVDGSTDIVVLLNDQREFRAKVIGGDQSTDIALLKIDATELPYLLLGNSDSLQVGEWVLAVGNPHKLQSTVTAGIVSAKGRNINILKNVGIESFIQTDAAVNSGNSGGALVNSVGMVVGINTAIISEGGGHEGFSFAIPINLVRKVVSDIKEYGAVQRGWMGVELRNVDFETAKQLGLQEVSGVIISLVIKGGAASEGGLQTDDIIKKIDEVSIKDMPQFMEKIGLLRPGDKIKIHYLRNGKENITYVTLRNQLNSTDLIAVRRDPILQNLGVELRNLDSYEKSKLNTHGIMVVSVM